jgi:NAD(P)-dependent dehydrogenase (short-subunit alcohol dehydrogenase family)
LAVKSILGGKFWSMKRTIIITGGNTGLGYSCAGYIAGSSNDYTIMIACRNVQKGNNVAEKLKEKTGNAEFYNSQFERAS